MKAKTTTDALVEGTACAVIGGVHKGKTGIARDIHTSKTGHRTLTVEQQNGVRFKTLAKNVEALAKSATRARPPR